MAHPHSPPLQTRSSPPLAASFSAPNAVQLPPPSFPFLSDHHQYALLPCPATHSASAPRHSTPSPTSPPSRSLLAPNGQSTPSKLAAGSRPIDVVSSRECGSKGTKAYKKNMKQLPSVRECLLAEAWERKRDQSLQEELSSALVCAKSSTEASQAMKSRSRSRSLTDDDFDELRGCIDLGFGFTQDYNPELCGTLPALEVYYAITESLQVSRGSSSPLSLIHSVSKTQTPAGSSSQSPISSWKIVSPGDHPQQVKARLRHWAQAVACTVRQCC